jgi:hypothetical protein
VVFGVERTVVVTFNRQLFRAQTRTLTREIRKRQRKLEKLQGQLRRRRPGDRGKPSTVAGVENQVKQILRGRHMKDLFRARVGKTGPGLPRLSFRFRPAAYQKLCSTLSGNLSVVEAGGPGFSRVSEREKGALRMRRR